MTASRNIQAKKQPPATVDCRHCGNPFTRRYSIIFNKFGTRTRWFCSTSCATTYRHPTPYFECATCKKVVAKSKRRGHYYHQQIYCSPGCQHRSLDKGGYIHKGYRWITVDKVPVLEHRHVMSKKVGRSLFPDETVHHIDGNRSNNDPSNLELWSSGHGPGQRVADKIVFARDILARYCIPIEVFTMSEAVSGAMAM